MHQVDIPILSLGEQLEYAEESISKENDLHEEREAAKSIMISFKIQPLKI